MKKILLLISSLTSLAFMQDECSEITNPEECYDMGCEWIILYEEIGNELIVTEGCSETGDGSDWNDEENSCEGLTEDECVLSEGCEWLSDSDNPNSWGSCVEGEWEDDSECYGLGYEDCAYLDFCEWISDSDNPNSWGSCIESDDWTYDTCENLDYEECLESEDCQPNYNAAGQFESCEEFNNTLFEWAYPQIAERCRMRDQPYPALTQDGALRTNPFASSKKVIKNNH